MANELRHGSVGTELTQAEWEAIGTHVLNSQATGDIVYAASSSQLSRLGKGADNTVLHLASGIPAWSATLAGLTLTTPTISSTGFANATHAHAASNSGGTISAGALSGTTLASGVVTTSATTVGTIATGVWQGTDVGVAYGGTGASSLTANGVLVGNGASAIGSIDMSTKGHVLIGDGSGNPQMLGVGTNTHVLTADSGETTGVKWAAPAAAAAGSLTGSTLASGVVTTSATTVGVLNAGSITSGFGTIDVGSSSIAGGSFDASDGDITNVGDIALDSISADSANVSIDAAVGSAIRLNDAQANVDVVIESDAADNLFMADASGGAIGIAGAPDASNGRFHVFPKGNLSTNYAHAIHSRSGTVTIGAGVTGSHSNVFDVVTLAFASAATITNAATIYISGVPAAGSNMTITNPYSLFVDAGTSRFDGDIDLNGTGTLLNVGNAGNDWLAASLSISQDTDSKLSIQIKNTSDGSSAEVELQLYATDGGGDPLIDIRTLGGSNWAIGIDNDEGRFAIANDNDLGGAADAIRISTGEVVTFNNAQGTDFDYRCESCGRHDAIEFTCCAKVAWYDDFQPLVAARRDKQEGLDMLRDLGIVEWDNSGPAAGVSFMNIQRGVHFGWSLAWQNRQRMDAQNEAIDERLKRIEQALGVNNGN